MYANNQPIKLELYDTNGDEIFDRIRPLIYPKTDIFVLCFSTIDRTTYENVWTKWYPEMKYYQPSAQCIIIGTKIDIRNDHKALKMLEETLKKKKKKLCSPVSHNEGEAKAKEFHALKYFECSAHTQSGLNDFIECIPSVVFGNNTAKKKGRHCAIL
jgi:small GTP-binding protein